MSYRSGAQRRPRQVRLGKSAATIVRGASAYSMGEGTRPPLDAIVRHAQGQRICHQRLPARRLAERVVSPPPPTGLGRDTTKDILALVVSVLRYRLPAQRRHRHHFQTLNFLAHGFLEGGVGQEDQPVRILLSWLRKTPSSKRLWTTSRKPDSVSGRLRA